jgi:hypothetical protein
MIYKYRIYVESRDGEYFDLEGEKLIFQSWADTAQKNVPASTDILNSFTFSVSTDNPSYGEIRKQLRDCLNFFTPRFLEAEEKREKLHVIIDFYSYGYQTYVNIDDFFSTNIVYNTDIQETEEDNTNGLNIVTELTFRNK